ncbi:hypothetical protein NDU88_005422 [Pleurodeles waltl]|uniref:Uncharacterized protein n=1 Tax=Pleurodeles waltl TaxID=8319 RepID=A0AAV7WDC1_PLEWA|nr:hypothetical protein NDU88_005422 [Pleurodeles waltl]
MEFGLIGKGKRPGPQDATIRQDVGSRSVHCPDPAPELPGPGRAIGFGEASACSVWKWGLGSVVLPWACAGTAELGGLPRPLKCEGVDEKGTHRSHAGGTVGVFNPGARARNRAQYKMESREVVPPFFLEFGADGVTTVRLLRARGGGALPDPLEEEPRPEALNLDLGIRGWAHEGGPTTLKLVLDSGVPLIIPYMDI